MRDAHGVVRLCASDVPFRRRVAVQYDTTNRHSSPIGPFELCQANASCLAAQRARLFRVSVSDAAVALETSVKNASSGANIT